MTEGSELDQLDIDFTGAPYTLAPMRVCQCRAPADALPMATQVQEPEDQTTPGLTDLVGDGCVKFATQLIGLKQQVGAGDLLKQEVGAGDSAEGHFPTCCPLLPPSPLTPDP